MVHMQASVFMIIMQSHNIVSLETLLTRTKYDSQTLQVQVHFIWYSKTMMMYVVYTVTALTFHI